MTYLFIFSYFEFFSYLSVTRQEEEEIPKMADDWRQCVEWLVRCQILPDDHKATKLESNAFDLAQALRDGSLICHLLNQLSPQCVDLKDFSPRPQMSQVGCKNCLYFNSIFVTVDV